MCNHILVITGTGVTVCLQYYLCVYLLFNIAIVKHLKFGLLQNFNP